MNLPEFFASVFERLDGIEARLSDLEQKTAEARASLTEITVRLDNIRDGVVNLTGAVEEMGSFNQAAYQLEELAEAARRRERLGWLADAKAAREQAS